MRHLRAAALGRPTVRLSDAGAVAATTILAAGAGVAIAASPRPLLILLPVGALSWMMVVRDVASVERALTLVLVGGAIVLGYGFANVGIRSGSAPIPLAEIILLPLVAAALLGRPEWRPPASIVVPVLAYTGIVGVRFLFDYPVWHSLAIRDATTGIELTTVFVGYRALSRDGIGTWVKRFEAIFLALLVVGSLDQIGAVTAHGPVVGLQQSVPLFGTASLTGAAVIAAMAFFAIYSTGARRTVLMAWSIALIAVIQERGLYVALVVVLIVLGASLRQPTGTWARAFTALAIGAGLLVLAAGMGISGRLGKLSPDFYVKHVETLAGAQGPGAGSFHDRITWTHKTLSLVAKSPKTELFGVGLGPDLAFGFKAPNGASVRKPHDDYLEVFARTGIVGFAVFAFVLWSLLATVVRWRSGVDDESRRFRAFVLSVAATYLTVAATQPLLAFPYGTVPTFFVLGLGVAASLRPSVERTLG
jgi:O-antigen ligase